MRRQACVVHRVQVQHYDSAAWLCAYRAMRRRAGAGWDEGRPRVRVERPEFICDQEEERAAAERGLVRFQRGVSALRDKASQRVPGGPPARAVYPSGPHPGMRIVDMGWGRRTRM